MKENISYPPYMDYDIKPTVKEDIKVFPIKDAIKNKITKQLEIIKNINKCIELESQNIRLNYTAVYEIPEKWATEIEVKELTNAYVKEGYGVSTYSILNIMNNGFYRIIITW